jgi:hypothetical protein
MLPGQRQAGGTRRGHRLGQHPPHRLLGERNPVRRYATSNRDDLALIVVADRISEDLAKNVVIQHDDGEDRGDQGERVEPEPQDGGVGSTVGPGPLQLLVERPGVVVDRLGAGAVVLGAPSNSSGTPVAVEVDHIVALAEAWRTGASGWSMAKHAAFAN